MSTVEDLRTNKAKRDKGNTIVESDYVLRDKSKEAKDNYPNTRDITNEVGKYAEELQRIKAEARYKAEADARAELASSGFLDELKASLKAELLADMKAEAKKPTGAK